MADPTNINDHDADIFIEAVELLTQTILYTRGVYPPAIFQKRRAYSTCAYISIYPPLNEYLKNCFAAALELKRNKQLLNIILCVYKDEDNQLEKYVFEVIDSQLQMVTDKYLLDFEEAIKKCHLQLDTMLKHLDVLSKKAKFKIILQTTESAFVSLEHNEHLQDFQWLYEGVNTNVKKTSLILPIIGVNSLSMQLYVEEIKNA